MSKYSDNFDLQELLTQCVGTKNYLGVYVVSSTGGDVSYKKDSYNTWKRGGNINLAITLADPKMVALLVELGATVSIDDVEYIASIYFMTNSCFSGCNKNFESERSDNALKILQFCYDIGVDTSSLEEVCPLLRRKVSYEALKRFDNFVVNLKSAPPEHPEFDFTNFELCFAELADEYAFNFTEVIECPESLCQKLESGFYGLDPDILCQRDDDFISENMVELSGAECEG